MSDYESTFQRFYSLEVRATMRGNRMSGHAAVFNRLARIGHRYERIAPQAFAKAVERDDVRCLLNHNPDNLLGRTTSGTLALSTDSGGLGVEVDLPDTTLGRDVSVLIERRDLTGMSFGFGADAGAFSHEIAPDGRQIRTVNDLELFDVSLATFPAYKDANDLILRTVDFTAVSNVRSTRERLIRSRAARIPR